MSTLGFFLGLVCVSAAAASFAAAGGVVLLTLLTRFPLASARRADVAQLCGLLPASAGAATFLLTALPALLGVAGFGVDHCLEHDDHHWHLCPRHFSGMPQWMTLASVIVVVTVFTRALVSLYRAHAQAALVRAASRLGRHSRFADGTVVVELDGPPSLLHAAGSFILVSRRLLHELGGVARDGVLAHEAAHIRRGDPQWLRRLSIATAFAPPGYGRWVSGLYRQAAEEAADEEAAVVVGAVNVAAAVVEVARIRRRSALDALPAALPAADGADLERRVLRLLALEPERRVSGARLVVAFLAVAGLAALPFVQQVHHLAESLLGDVGDAERPHQHDG